MLQIFYKEKPIIISDKKSDLKNSLIIDPELVENLDLLKLLTKKKINSIGVFSNEFDPEINENRDIFCENTFAKVFASSQVLRKLWRRFRELIRRF